MSFVGAGGGGRPLDRGETTGPGTSRPRSMGPHPGSPFRSGLPSLRETGMEKHGTHGSPHARVSKNTSPLHVFSPPCASGDTLCRRAEGWCDAQRLGSPRTGKCSSWASLPIDALDRRRAPDGSPGGANAAGEARLNFPRANPRRRKLTGVIGCYMAPTFLFSSFSSSLMVGRSGWPIALL